jgi:uncharacterized protein YdeI (YjbR/CyaY-like superfamily)
MKIPDADTYFAQGCGRCKRFATPDCSTRTWAEVLARLRRICLDVGLDETLKWSHPCYTHAGRNVAIFGAFKGDARLTFIDPGLLTDAAGILEHAGPNSQQAGTVRFTSVERVIELEPILRAYLAEAKQLADRGIKAPKVTREVDLPEELIDALDADPELADAFARLTPGRQRSYAVHLASAKTSSTRVARIAKARPKILAGKGALER